MKLLLPYVPPHNTPLYWMNEQSGQLKEALLAFLDASLKRRVATDAQLETTRAYFEYIIHAPCWMHPEIDEEYRQKVTDLRARITEAKTLALLKDWIDECLDIGIDPL